MKTVVIDPKSDLKITNVCLSDTIQSAEESSRVSLAQDYEPMFILLLEPFQVYAWTWMVAVTDINVVSSSSTEGS